MNRSFFKKYIILSLLVLSVLFSIGIVFHSAQASASDVGLLPNTFKNGSTLCDFLVTLLNAITEIGAIIGVLVLIATGFYFVLAQGNKDKLQTAKRALLMAILGITLLLGASVFAHILITTVNAVLTAGGGGFANQSALTCSP